MIVEVEIKSCNDCIHLDHTGGFTPGGAKPCCDHPVTVKEKGYDCFKRVVKYKRDYDNDTRVAKGIADFCPLKKGANYNDGI